MTIVAMTEGFRPIVAESSITALWSHVEEHGSCWVYTGSHTKDGYGKATYGKTTWRVHRLVYQLMVRKLRIWEVLDHLCRNRACCNPDHFLVTTMLANTLSGFTPKLTHCRRAGHRLSDEDRDSKTGRRRCRACVAEREKVAA